MAYLPNSDFSLFTDLDTGEVFSNLSKLALMCGVSKQAIRQGVNFKPIKTAEMLTAGGMQGVNLYDEDTILEALYHYDDLGRVEAKQTLRSFSKIGLKVVIQSETGYHSQSESVQNLVDDLSKQWQDLRSRHSLIYEGMRKFGAKVTDQLNIAYYGVSCKEFKSARFLQSDAPSDCCPDYAAMEELKELVDLRENFVRSRGTSEQRIASAVKKTNKMYA